MQENMIPDTEMQAQNGTGAPEPQPPMQNPAGRLVPLSEFRSTETEWLWYPYIPLGKVTIMQGDPGEGKSSIALYLAAAVSRGLDPENPREIITTPDIAVYQNAEDGIADTVKPRLERAKADCDMVYCLDDSQIPLSVTDGRIGMILRELHPKLLILDPLQAYLGDDVDMHRANEVRPVMRMLSDLAEQYHCAILLIGHMNKMQKTKSLYRGLGSIDLTAAARSVLLVTRDPAHPENRVIMQIKNSLAAEGKSVGFRVEDNGSLTFLGEYELTTEEALDAERRAPSQGDRAEALILEWLEKEQPLYARDMYLIADSEDISKETLMRAKKKLGIMSRKTEHGWIWVGRADSRFPSGAVSEAHPC